MKKITFLFVAVALMPMGVGAHGVAASFEEVQMGPEMMRYIEDQALENDELHEEMEGLMVKMTAGDLAEEEANRFAELMDEYPGPMGMMMYRTSATGNNWGGTWGMMGSPGWGMMGGTGTFFAWLAVITWIVWLGVGILAIAWLWRQIQKK